MTDIPELIGGQPILGIKQDHCCEGFHLAAEVACDANAWELAPDAARWPEPSPGHDLGAEQRELAAYRAFLSRHITRAVGEDWIHANPQLTAHLPLPPIEASTRYAVDDATIAAAALASHRAALARHSDGPILGGDTA